MAERDRVFDPFYRTLGSEQIGSGLGLSIVDRISRVLNHSVDLQSKPGKGTRFRVTMPIDKTAKAVKGPANTAAIRIAEPLNGLAVLCIDNEPRILEGMTLLLEGWGCRVEAVQSIEDWKAGSQMRPDAIIADYHLDKATGTDAIRTIRDHFETALPALLVTADRSPEVRATAERDGIAIQNKPVRPAALRAWLTQLSVALKAAAE